MTGLSSSVPVVPGSSETSSDGEGFGLLIFILIGAGVCVCLLLVGAVIAVMVRRSHNSKNDEVDFDEDVVLASLPLGDSTPANEGGSDESDEVVYEELAAFHEADHDG
jgi:heme/copper-type cytochrome/quinol oxidase subunit 2